MFDTAEILFKNYGVNASRFKVYSIVARRGDSPEEVYYLCHIGEHEYIVFETDYPINLELTEREALELFEPYGVEPLKWLIKRGTEPSDDPTFVSFGNLDINDKRQILFYQKPNSHLRYAVMLCDGIVDEPNSPQSYGG